MCLKDLLLTIEIRPRNKIIIKILDFFSIFFGTTKLYKYALLFGDRLDYWFGYW